MRQTNPNGRFLKGVSVALTHLNCVGGCIQSRRSRPCERCWTGGRGRHPGIEKYAMRIALVVPGGVDRSLEYRVIPALLALISRLAIHNDVHVFALYQEIEAGESQAAGAHIHNIGS